MRMEAANRVRFSLRSLLLGFVVVGLVIVWSTYHFKSNNWYMTQSKHILVDVPDLSEDLTVAWLKSRGYSESPDQGDTSTPRFGRYLIDGTPAHRYFVRQEAPSSAPVYISLRVVESTPPARDNAPAPKTSVIVAVTVGYYDVWPWENVSYKAKCRKLSDSLTKWVDTTLKDELTRH